MHLSLVSRFIISSKLSIFYAFHQYAFRRVAWLESLVFDAQSGWRVFLQKFCRSNKDKRYREYIAYFASQWGIKGGGTRNIGQTRLLLNYVLLQRVGQIQSIRLPTYFLLQVQFQDILKCRLAGGILLQNLDPSCKTMLFHNECHQCKTLRLFYV